MKVWAVFLGMYLLVCQPGDLGVTGDGEFAGRVLVFTKTAGYRHHSIPAGVSLFRRLGRKHEFKVDRTENAADFTDEGLRPYDLIIFLSTTGDVLNVEQQMAFERFVAGGGSFMGVHAAVDTEYDWPWYGKLVGAYFNEHPKVQPATLVVENHDHPATSFLPAFWERTDEWYDLKHVQDDIEVLLTIDEDSYEGGRMGSYHPVSWYKEAGDSRIFYTALGHTSETFREPLFESHILGGLLWCLRKNEIE